MGDVMIPILKNTKDPHYRYKMPKLTAKVEGSGNGIKTVITNMVAVSKALDRPPAYPTKYFGCELGAQVSINNDLFVVNGCHDPEKLQKLLYGFIDKFVLCTKCNNPETNLTINHNKIGQKCIACGYDTTINKSIHKITTYIINHPPDGSSGVQTTTIGSSKKEKGLKGSKSKNGGSKSPDNDNKKKYIEANDHNHEEDEWDDEELTTDAYADRMRELCEGLNNANVRLDSKQSADIFSEYFKEKMKANLLLDATVQKEIVKEAERLNIKDKSILIIAELLFTENILEEIKAYKMLLLRFCHENRKAQKYLMGAFEQTVGERLHEALFGKCMLVLKALYDEDVLDEEIIMEWSQKESKKYVSKAMSRQIHEKVAPFIKWLKEAETEEDSSSEDGEDMASKSSNSKTPSLDIEDDEDDIELEFSHRAAGIEVKEEKASGAQINPAIVEGLARSADLLDDDIIDEI